MKSQNFNSPLGKKSAIDKVMQILPLLLLAAAFLTGCATPENRRELTGPYYPYLPIPFTEPKPTDPNKTTVELLRSPRETTVWYGPDTRRQITGRWGMAGHLPDLNYPNTPPGIEQRVISRINSKGLRAQKIADQTFAAR